MPTEAATPGLFRIGQKLLWVLLLSSAVGCGHGQYSYEAGLAQRMLPPEPAQALSSDDPKPVDPVASEKGPVPAPGEGSEASCGPAQTLTLAQAIDTAFRQQPRLRVYLESVEQAKGAQEVAFAPFLPLATAGYSFGGFDLNVGGHNVLTAGPIPGFTFLPGLGALPFGVNVNTGFELADFKLQWLICDFGRRLGRYSQAGLATDIAQLQCDRAYQTVSNEVSVAYYTVLRTRALRNTAAGAVRRAAADLEEIKKQVKKDVFVKERELRAEVMLAQTQQLLDAAESAVAVAVAGLNLAIGLNVNVPTCPEEDLTVPPCTQSLAQCLQTAVMQRREFQVAQKSIAVAAESRNVAKADFAPRVVAEGSLFDFQQSDPRGHADLALGFIKLEWALFEGGKRVAELHVSDSKIRAAMAQAESIADTIAFQVTEAYRQMCTARRGIDRSRPAVTQTEEALRLVKARLEKGDATPTELTDAESALTRAQMDHFNAIHDYLIALARLEYAMGVSPMPGIYYGHP